LPGNKASPTDFLSCFHPKHPVSVPPSSSCGVHSSNNVPIPTQIDLNRNDSEPSRNGIPQHDIPDADIKNVASFPHRINTAAEPTIEHEEFQARLDTLDFRKEEINKEISHSLKTLNDVLSCLTATRLRLRGTLEEARTTEQVMFKSAREEAMMSRTAGDGEQDTERIEKRKLFLKEKPRGSNHHRKPVNKIFCTN